MADAPGVAGARTANARREAERLYGRVPPNGCAGTRSYHQVLGVHAGEIGELRGQLDALTALLSRAMSLQ